MDKRIGAWLHAFIPPIKKQYAQATVLLLLSALGYIGFAYSISIFFSNWIAQQFDVKWLLYAAAAYAFRFFFNYWALKTFDQAADEVVHQAQQQLFQAALENQTIEATQAVDLISHKIEDIKPYYANFIPHAMAAILISILILSFLFYIDAIVGTILLLALLLIPIQMIAVGYGAEAIHKQNTELLLRYSAIFYNRIKAIATIQNLGILKEQNKLIADKSKAVNEANMKVMKVAMLSSTFMEFFVTLSIAIVAIYLGMSLLGYMPFTTAGIGYSYLHALFILLLTPFYYLYLRKLVSAYHDRNQAYAIGELILPILHEQRAHDNCNSEIRKQEFNRIKISNLSFAYQQSQPQVLTNINFEFPQKGLIWLAGISGSGKSTLLKILTGFLTNSSGELQVNGLSKEQSVQWLMENSNYFNQRTFIFEGTIRENIAMKSELQDPDLLNIITESGLNTVLKNKNMGLETPLTNQGIELSGGEKQLLGMARILANPKPILLLDEPTASLDKLRAANMLNQLQLLSKKHLIIIASHQLELKKLADQTLELSLGIQHG